MTRESARGYGRIGALALFAASGAASAGTILVTHGDEAPASALTCTLGQAIHAANRANNPNGSFGDTPTGSTTIDPLDYSVATYVGTGTCSGASMGANTIDLLPIAGQTLTFDPAADYPDQGWNGDVADRADNYWYGPNALPPVASTILIEGSGVILEIPEGTARLRFFFVGADPAGDGPTPGYNTPGPGDLTLREITLRGGRQLGGSGGTARSGSSGGGAGLGGAIYNQGRLRLQRSTLHGNAATGGDGSDGGVGVRGGGGGIGSDSSFNSAGGMGGAVPGGSTDAGHAGQVGPPGQGGGGGGPDVGLAGAGSGTAAGAGGNGGGGGNDFGGGGGGFGGGPGGIGGNGGDGGSFGGGGSGGLWFIGGGGGAGGGGGSPDSSSAGGGGFGGGGGGAFEAADGGFGGGVGGGHGGVAGFGGGTAFEAGGGAGMGGAIFNHSGEVALENVTLYDNQAVGGSGFFDGAGDGLGLGGAIFNLNGELRIDHATIAGNLAQQGGAIFSLGYNARTDAGSHTATVTVARSVFADNGTGGDLSNTAPEVLARDQANAATQSLAVSGSIIEDPTGATFTPGSTYISADPLLESLEDAGGPTPTLVPGIGSPAVDTVACGTSVVADQRGVPRPRGSGCDRGAVERTGIVVLAGALPPLDADEGNGGTRTLAIPLQLAPISDVPPNGPVSFDYALTPAAGSSGTVADDFVGAVTGTVSIASPDTSTEVVLTIRADETVEPDEAFVLALASPPGGADFEPAQYTITLRNDDSTSGEPGLVFRDGFED